MQSYLQYKRIRAQLVRQLERHGNKSVGDTSSSSGGSPSDRTQDGAQRDVEKEAADPGSLDHTTSETSRNASDEDVHRESIESTEHEAHEDAEADAPRQQDHTASVRPASRASSTSRSLRTIGTSLGHRLTGVDVRDRTTKEGGDRDQQVFVIDFEGPDDLTNPHNWSYATRIKTTFLVASIGVIVGIASSIDSSILMPAAQEFGVAEVTESLATGLYL